MKKRYLYVGLAALAIDLLARFFFPPQEDIISNLELMVSIFYCMMSLSIGYFLILSFSSKLRSKAIKYLFVFVAIWVLLALLDLFWGHFQLDKIIGSCLGGALSYFIYLLVNIQKIKE